MSGQERQPPVGGEVPGPSPSPSQDTLSDDVTDPWAVFLGAAQATTDGVNAALGFFTTPTGLEDLTGFAEQDLSTFELGMTRLVVYARRRAKSLRDVVMERLAARLEKSAPARTLVDDLGDLAPDDAANLLVPFGYRLDRGGTWRVSIDGSTPMRVAGAPVAILGEEVDAHADLCRLRLGWMKPDGEWGTVLASRAHTSDPGAVVRFAGNGAPWNALEARDVVKYLTAFERANLHTMPRTETTSRMGWHEYRGAPAFVLPDRVLGAKGLSLSPGEGMAANTGGWCVSGSWEEWRAILPYLASLPLAMLGIHASLASPLIWILHGVPFTVDFSGVTSGGKSSTLRLAASVWGSPLEGDGVFHSWGDTQVHSEIYAGFAHSLPVIFDDTKAFRSGYGRKVPGDFVYLFSQGRGRGRGTKGGGVSPPGTWRNILISSGEAPLAGYGKDAGVYARTVHVRGRPLGDDEAHGRELSKWLNAVAAANHGHAGERWVTWLLRHRDRWPSLVERWRVLDAGLSARAPGRIAGRLGGYLATLQLAEELAAEVLDIPVTGAVDAVVASIYEHALREDVPLALHEILLNWAVSNVARFWPRSDAAPSSGWAGRWDAGSDWVWIMPSVAEHVLADMDGRLTEVEDTWVQRGLARRRAATDVAGNTAQCLGLRMALDVPAGAGVGQDVEG